MSQIEIEIDGKKIKTEPGKMLIQVADDAGIYVPRYCYHKKLSVAANCRMCLVEVDKAPKTLPACATQVVDGMKVFTQSKKTLESQRAVMEFLLVNHPLDCPICDQGGQCELQDVAMGYGKDVSEFDEGKRAVENQDFGPLIATEMTRCICCTRCVRFGQEVAGVREIGALGRGEHTQIGTYVKQTVSHEMSGNVIDLCPVGALLSKPFLYSARAWELEQFDSIAPHDCVGSNIHVHTRRHQVMRVVPKENEAINETWISDRDRYAYSGLRKERLHKPMIKDGDTWREVEWPVALNFVAEALTKIKANDGEDQIGALLSPNTPTEEAYLLQKVMRGIGVNNIDFRLREIDHSDQNNDPQAGVGFAVNLEELEQQQAVLLVGCNIRKEAPIIAHRIRKATLNGAKVMAVNMVNYQHHFPIEHELISVPSQFKVQLGKVLKACIAKGLNVSINERTKHWLDHYVETDASSEAMVDTLVAADKAAIILGASARHYFKSSSLRYIAQLIAKATGATFNYLTDGANSAGCYQAGAVPHRGPGAQQLPESGMSVREMLKNPRQAYWIHGIEPTLDVANPSLVRDALSKARMVVATTAFDTPMIRELASVMLPITPFSETSGSFVNVEGKSQRFTASVKPLESARPGWKVFRVLGNVLELDGFDFESSQEVSDELSAGIDGELSRASEYAEPDSIDYQFNEGLELISEVPMYAVDGVVRRSPALQEMQRLEDDDAVKMHVMTSKQMNVHEGEEILVQQLNDWQRFRVVVDNSIPEHAVFLSAATKSAECMGDMFGLVKLKNG